MNARESTDSKKNTFLNNKLIIILIIVDMLYFLHQLITPAESRSQHPGAVAGIIFLVGILSRKRSTALLFLALLIALLGFSLLGINTGVFNDVVWLQIIHLVLWSIALKRKWHLFRESAEN